MNFREKYRFFPEKDWTNHRLEIHFSKSLVIFGEREMVITRGRIALAVLATSGVLGGFGVGSGSAAHAATMDTLDKGSGFLSDGNATYSDFVYGGTTVDTSVTATASTSGNTSTITFARTSPTTPWTLGDDGSQITFDVTFATPITSIGLDFLGSASLGGEASVGETVIDPATGDQLASLQVDTGIGTPQLTDSFTFASPVSSLEIIKSIDVAGSGDALATITSVDNTYTTSTPEPASLGLLGLGALVMIKRRR
jgi:hypothetical protein